MIMSSTEIIDKYLSAIDSGKIFNSHDPDNFRRIRTEMAGALSKMLVWERPEITATRGISWPYDALQDRLPIFLTLAKNGSNSFIRRQAQYFLAFLPFPTQWHWMLQIERWFPGEAELQDFLRAEEEEILRKIASKPQRHFKLRHFCQVLKAPRSDREKGVLRIFSLPYLFIHAGILTQLSQRYLLYVEPPMGIIFRHLWWRYFSALKDPCIFGIHSEEDRNFLKGQKGVETVGMAHGDFMEDIPWLDTGVEKQYDIVFNATFDDMPRKRHELMLKLLLHPLLEDKIALFLGRGEPENVRAFNERIEAMNLDQRVTVMANLKRSDVPKLLGRCRIGVHLSLYENACRGVYEFFRSDLPCVVSVSMGGMNLDLFNPKTGKAVGDKDLPEAIHSVWMHRENYSPRRWFLDNSGSIRSTRKLNDSLAGLSKKWGYEWSQDIVPLGSSGPIRYTNESDYRRFIPEFQVILQYLKGIDSLWGTFSIE